MYMNTSRTFKEATSRSAILFAILTVQWLVVNLYSQLPYAWTFIISSILFITVYFLNRFNNFYARLILFLNLNSLIFYFSLAYGTSGTVEIFFLLILSMQYAMFSIMHEKKYIVAFTLLTLGLWITLYLNDFKLFNIETIPLAIKPFIHINIMVAILVCVIVQLYNYSIINIDFYQKLRNLQSAALQESKNKTTFLNTMSHEIRTPLNAINGISFLLKSEKPENHQLELINSIESSGKKLVDMLNNYLEFSKYQGDMVELENRTTDLNISIAEKLAKYEECCQKKGISFKAEISKNIPKVIIDIDKFFRILDNLISNALQFTNEGEIYLSIQAKKIESNQLELDVSVKDTGKGISKIKQQLILDKNDYIYSLLKSDNKIGLGLPIIKLVLQLMDSKLQVKSMPGLGSRFQFTLNLETGSAQPNNVILNDNTTNSNKTDLKLAGKKVLLVDDNQLNILVAQKFLEKQDLSVEVANDGLEAIEKAKSTHFDIILMDINMPKLNGFEACEKIREFNTKVPILAMTASVLEEIKDDLDKFKFNGLILKPFKPEALILTLKNSIVYE